MTFNEQYFDASIRHQIDLLRFGSGVSRKVNSLLDATRADLAKQVERRLGKVTGINGASLRRLRELERAIDQQRSGAWNDVTEEWSRVAVDVALEEPMFVAGALTSILPVELDLVQPSDATLRALATTRPFQGKFLKEWADSTSRADLTRIHQQIRIGMVQGESSRDIASRVFGARGAMNVTRAQVDAVTRTVINHVSNAAQQEFLRANSDLFSVEQLVATLDSRTTPVCRAQDGKQYPVGKGPIPPLHVACRSIRVGVLDGEVVGERPFKAGTQQQMLREYADAHGLERVRSRDDLPRGHKSAFDAFSRRRMRELTGQVPARRTYQEWLSRQPPEIQDDILGPTRGKLFREGGLKLDRFVNREGDELTLDELRERNREAWRKAGLEREAPAPPRQPDRRRTPPPAPAPSPAPAPANDTVRPPPIPAPPPELPPLQRIARETGAALRYEFGTTRAQQDAVARGIGKVARSAHVPLTELLLTSRVGNGLEELPDRVGGDYNSGFRRLRISTRDGTNNLFLRRMTLNPNSASLPGNTQNVAPDLNGVIEMTAVHEYAHHMHMTLPRLGPVDALIQAEFEHPDRQDVSYYGQENHLEFWAESLTAYHYYPRAWLERRAPRTLAMVSRVLKLLGDE